VEESHSIHIYHGPGRERNPQRLAEYDIVITTYNTLAAEFIKPKSKKKKRKKGAAEEELKAAKQTGPLFRVPWLRVVLDECHAIRERNTRQVLACLLVAWVEVGVWAASVLFL